MKKTIERALPNDVLENGHHFPARSNKFEGVACVCMVRVVACKSTNLMITELALKFLENRLRLRSFVDGFSM